MAERDRAAQDQAPTQAATAPERMDLFDTELEARSFDEDAGESAAMSIDPRAIGEPDNAQLDWGEPLGDDGLVHGANHTRRAVSTEADRGHGPKTRQRAKDIINRKM